MANRTFSVKITGDAKDLKRAFGDASSSAKQFDRDLVNFGKKGALALAGVAAASTKLASDFENSMSKMVGLVGLADSEVDGFKDSILALSGETARAPQELADAMFFITSAGLRGSDALDALEASAKASAAGLGDTKDVAFAAVSAVNAYGKENLSASKAVEILIGTVREGNVEASEVAASLGSVIPIAAELGIGFEEVGAAIAAMTRLGANASESTTALQAVMSTLIQPTAEAEERLSSVGLSIGQLREEAGSGGILPVLLSLKDAFGGNVEAMGEVFGNVRALRGVLNLVGENAATAEQIFGNLADTTGLIGEAFGAVADDEGQKLRVAFNDLKIELTEIGEDVLPKVASVLSDNREEIGDTVESVGDLTVSFVELVAAMEPLIGRLPDLGDAANIVANSAVNVGAGLAAGIVKFNPWIDAQWEAAEALAENAAANNRLIGSLRDVEKGLDAGRDGSILFQEELAGLASSGDLVERAIARLSTEAGLSEDQTIAATEAVIDWAEANDVAAEDILLLKRVVSELRGEVRTATPEQQELADKIQQTAAQARGGVPDVDAYGNAIGGIGDGAEGIDAVTDAIKAQQTEIRKAIDPVFRLRDAEDKRNEAVAEFNKLQEDGADQEALNDAAQDAADAQADLEFAFDLVNGKVSEGITLIEGYGTRAGLSADAVARLREETIKLAAAMRTLPTVGEARALDVDDPNRIRILKEELERRARGEVGG